MLGTVWISLQNWNLIGKARFAGADNEDTIEPVEL